MIFFSYIAISWVIEGHLVSNARDIYELVIAPLKLLDKHLVKNNVLNERRGAVLFFCGIFYFGMIGIIVHKLATILILFPVKIWLYIEPIVEHLSVNYPRIFD